MNGKTAVVIGASGLIGGHLVEQLLQDDHFDAIRILVRRTMPLQHIRLQQQIVDFNNIEDYKNKFGTGDIIFCCVGTTQKKVKGDKAAYKKVDLDIPVNAASIGISKGFKKFITISSVGADSNSSNFYLQLKGKMEAEVKLFPFESVSIFRPSMLLGKRNESRPAEKIGQILMNTFSFAFVGRLKKYHPIKADDVAKAMVAESKLNNTGVHILEYNEIKNLIR